MRSKFILMIAGFTYNRLVKKIERALSTIAPWIIYHRVFARL